MKKDYFSDYATGVFIQYARLGRPTRADIVKRIEEQVNINHRFKSRLERQAILKKELKRHEGLVLDIEAVNVMIDMLSGKIPIPYEFNQKDSNNFAINALDVLESVFFKSNRYGLNSKNLTLRVRRFATLTPCDERTAWRAIRRAKRLFAIIRGLSTEFIDEIKISED